jgi:pseudouridine synthase
VPVRLNRYLASAGIGSRRAVEQLIRDGRVTVNGQTAGLATTVGDDDRVAVDGRDVAAEQQVYLMLHKPQGVVTTSDDPEGRRTVLDLVDVPERVFAVGRLDYTTSGLLLLTNDGGLADRLMHPRHGVVKTYVARVDGDPGPAALQALRDGVELEDGPTAPAQITRLAPRTIELRIHEGRNRQVRRMCEAIGHPVRDLHRSGYAGLELQGLEVGRWRPLTEAELEALRQAAGLSTEW